MSPPVSEPDQADSIDVIWRRLSEAKTVPELRALRFRAEALEPTPEAKELIAAIEQALAKTEVRSSASAPRGDGLTTYSRRPPRSKVPVLALLAVVILGAIFVWFPTKPAKIEIEIDRSRLAFGPGGEDVTTHIGGTVRGVKPESVRIAVYAFDKKWYVQPYAGDVLQPDGDGLWGADIHRGLRYVALLVPADFAPAREVPAQEFIRYSSSKTILAKAEIDENKQNR